MLGERLRKSRTAAGFVPKPCETATSKTLETSPTDIQTPATCEPMLTKTQPVRSKAGHGKPHAKKQTSSTNRAQRTQKNTSKSASGHLWIHYKPLEKRSQEAQTMPNTSNTQTPATCEPMPTKTQPASGPKLAMVKVLRVTFGSTTNLWKNDLSKTFGKTASAGFEPNAHKKTPVKVLRVTFGSTTNLWKNGLKKPKPCQTLATLKHQQHASPCSPKRSPRQI